MSLVKIRNIVVEVECQHCDGQGWCTIHPGAPEHPQRVRCDACDGTMVVHDTMTIESFLELVKRKIMGTEGLH